MIIPNLTLSATDQGQQEQLLTRLATFTPAIKLSVATPADLLAPNVPMSAIARAWASLATAPADTTPDAVLALLDAGVDKAIVPYTTAEHVSGLLRSIPAPDRLLVHFQDWHQVSPSTLSTLTGLVSGIVLPLADNVTSDQVSQVLALVRTQDKRNLLVIDSLAATPAQLELVLPLARLGATITVSASAITFPATNSPQAPQGIPAATLLTSLLTSDRPDGLFPTIVTDTHATPLGLVYSSPASLAEALRTGTGVYYSRSRSGLWYKGATSGATQQLVHIDADCDTDALRFIVHQHPPGFCHRDTHTCFGTGAAPGGIAGLARTLQSRKMSAPEGSYTSRLFNDKDLLDAKLLEEAQELVDAGSASEVAQEAADVIFFVLAKATKAGVSLADIEAVLDARARKVTRRKGDAKPQYAAAIAAKRRSPSTNGEAATPQSPASAIPQVGLKMKHVDLTTTPSDSPAYAALLQRPILNTDKITKIVQPIIQAVREQGDAAVVELTKKFDRVDLAGISPVLLPPFAQHYNPADLRDDVRAAIDTAIRNVETFHQAQLAEANLEVETMPGITCSRIVRPIERVGLYVPGGSAVLPSSTLMLGVPARVAGCNTIVIATPPRADGSVAPEVLYVADKVGAAQVVRAGGAQAVAAMAYGTESVLKVDKICGPGNQFVTAAKLVCATDTNAMVSVDMPAGPSEVLVIADPSADPRYVAADLLSQAEHGPDSQVVLVAVGMSDAQVAAVEDQVRKQAEMLPRVDIVKQCLPKSWVVRAPSLDVAVDFSNAYAPEHLILNLPDTTALAVVDKITNAGSVFVGAYSPESCGDYASGTNHTLPTYGYARMYSGVNTGTFVKHITTQYLTKEGLAGLAECVMTLAEVEGLDAHARAVAVRVGKFDV